MVVLLTQKVRPQEWIRDESLQNDIQEACFTKVPKSSWPYRMLEQISKSTEPTQGYRIAKFAICEFDFRYVIERSETRSD